MLYLFLLWNLLSDYIKLIILDKILNLIDVYVINLSYKNSFLAIGYYLCGWEGRRGVCFSMI